METKKVAVNSNSMAENLRKEEAVMDNVETNSDKYNYSQFPGSPKDLVDFIKIYKQHAMYYNGKLDQGEPELPEDVDYWTSVHTLEEVSEDIKSKIKDATREANKLRSRFLMKNLYPIYESVLKLEVSKGETTNAKK